MRFNDLLHLVAFPWKAHGTPPASGFVTAAKMPESRAFSKLSDHFSRYIPLSALQGSRLTSFCLTSFCEAPRYLPRVMFDPTKIIGQEPFQRQAEPGSWPRARRLE